MPNLSPYNSLPINIFKFSQYAEAAIVKGVKYKMGAKAPVNHLMDYPIKYTEIDCSGFARAIIAYSTAGATILPDGSCNEAEALAKLGLKDTDKANCALADDHLRICVHIADDLDSTGHIWFVRNKITTESYGGHGVGHRAWNAKLSSGHSLNDLATHCFVAL